MAFAMLGLSLRMYLVMSLPLALGLDTGAPFSACESMRPRHQGIEEQTSPSPYSISTNSDTYTPGHRITVTITGDVFKGILLQARSAYVNSSVTPVGTFYNVPANARTLQCANLGDSLTHRNPEIKEDFSVQWNPPAQDVGDLVFVATIAKERTHYWLGHESGTLSYSDTPRFNAASHTSRSALYCLAYTILYTATW